MKSHPQFTLVHRQRQRGGDFLNDLGKLMFGETWDAKYLRFLGSEPFEPGTPGAEAFTVQDNFFEAMRLEMGGAELELTDLLISRLYSSAEERLGPGGATIRIPSAGIYPIKSSYWNEDDFDSDSIDWNLSIITVPAKYIEFTVSGPFPLPRNDEVLDAPFYVAEPDLLLAKAVHVPPLPVPDEIKRYSEGQRAIWLEVMGVTWRLLAIEKPEERHGLQADLIAKVRHYMKVHRLDSGGDEPRASDQTMKAVVSKILEQWRTKNTRDSVLVSSTPRSR